MKLIEPDILFHKDMINSTFQVRKRQKYSVAVNDMRKISSKSPPKTGAVTWVNSSVNVEKKKKKTKPLQLDIRFDAL